MRRHTLAPMRGQAPIDHESHEARVERLAGEFREQLAGNDDGWSLKLHAWAQGLKLSAAEEHDIRVLILRARAFGSMRRSMERAR